MPNWSPDVWDDFSVVGIAVAVAVATVFLVASGRLIPRSVHREVIAAKDRQLNNADTRAAKDADTIAVQAQAIAEKNAIESVTTHMLQSFREATERGS
ncbi:MAG: hypothetical protein ACPGVG_11765 [Mycobacterium sp.]